MVFRFPLVVLFLWVMLLPGSLLASPGGSGRIIPEALQDWVGWVREPDPCPRVSGPQQEEICAWPYQLLLEQIADRAPLQFRQQWDVFRPGWIPLPGDSSSWPVAVQVNDTAAVVISRHGKPFIHADKGELVIKGELAGTFGQHAFAVSPQTALVKFIRTGAEHQVFLDAKSMLRFQPGGYAGVVRPRQEKDFLSLKVFRRLTDNVPTDTATVLRLTVSGKPREVSFGKVTLPGAIPVAVSSKLNASINEKGELTAVVKPGIWEITFSSYFPADSKIWQRGKAGGDFWPANEYWFFKRMPALYATEVKGSPPVDPKSVDAPRSWSNLPGYLVGPGGKLEVKRLSRGTLATGETRARIDRDAWISFSGEQLFIKDHVVGEAKPYSSLVVAQPDFLPKAIYLNEQPQVLVNTPEGIGVSLRNRRLNAKVLGVMADSHQFEMPGNYFSELKAESQTARLHLPPGWRLLAIDGGIKGATWMSRWSLYLVFLLVIISISFARVIGPGWGLFAALTLGITFHEPETPALLWLLLLGLTAVLRDGVGNYPKLKALLQKGRTVVLLMIAVMVLGYTITHVRDAIHPQLNWSANQQDDGDYASDVTMATEAMPAPERVLREQLSSGAGMALSKNYSSAPRLVRDKAETKEFKQENEIRSTVGIPQWQGRVYFLQWDNSELQRAKPFKMVLLTPVLNLIFGFVSSAMLVILLMVAAGVNFRHVLERIRTRKGRAVVAPALILLVGIAGFSPGNLEAADFPSEELLQQLAKEVNQVPACLPDCVSLDKLHVTLSPEGKLSMRFLVDVIDSVAAPLLEVSGGGVEFRAFALRENGMKNLPLLHSGKNLLLKLEKGVHEVVLYANASAPEIQLGIPLSVRQYSESVTGWQPSHVRGRDAWQSLSFRLKSSTAEPAGEVLPKGLPQSRVPAFFDVSRELKLSDGMYIDTTIRRLSPVGMVETAVIPAWPKELILQGSEQVSRQGDVINVVFRASDTSLKFRSSLQYSDDELKGYQGGVLRKIVLPPASAAQRTRWNLDYASQWEIAVEGLPVIYQQTRSGANTKSIRPWPGESATLLISRVEPIPGDTVAVQKLELVIAPHEVRHGGIGGTLEINADIETTQAQTLQLNVSDAVINQVMINGQRINNEASDSVRVPLDVGRARVQIAGELKSGLTGVYHEPKVSLKTPAGDKVDIYNATTEVTMPENRWVYRADGRGVGPDFLFWSILPPLLLVALALHFLKLGQINGISWLLVMIGFTQANSFGLYIGIGMSALFIGWLYLLKLRENMRPFDMSAFRFNSFQIILLLVTIASLLSMADGLFNGLLGHPKMQVAGNGSDAYFLRWFNDHGMPQASVMSLPLLYYRIVILVWAIWLSFIVLRWVKYGWKAFSSETLFRPRSKQAVENDTNISGKTADKVNNSGGFWLYLVGGLLLFFVVFKWFF